MFTIPIDLILSWPLPSAHPETRGPELWIVSGIFLFAATVCVSLRLFARIFIRRWFGLDDLLIVLAYIFSVAVTVCATLGTLRYDWDRHIWELSFSRITPGLKTLYFARIFWGLSSSFVRLSVLCLYYRLLDGCEASRLYYRILHATTLFNVCLLLYYFFSGVLPCQPIDAYWTYPPPEGSKCLNDGLSMQVAAVFNTFSETWVASLPLVAVFKLRVDYRQRWTVISLLSLGYFVSMAGIVRTYFIFKLFTTYDLTWWSGPQWICSEVEIDLALICACAAPIRPLAGRIHARIFSPNKPLLLHVDDSDATSPIASGLASGRKASAVSQDFEAINDWATAISRQVDLEGIVTQDYGYSVSITGPPPKEKSRMKFPGFSRRRVEKVSPDSSRTRTSTRLDISTKTTEVCVMQSYNFQSPQPKVSFWENLADSPRGTTQPENMEFITAIDRKHSDQVHYSLPREPSPIQWFNSRTDDFQAIDETIEALPQLPSPTFSEYNTMSPTSPTFRRMFHSRSFSRSSRN